jgi:hypothetical protein
MEFCWNNILQNSTSLLLNLRSNRYFLNATLCGIFFSFNFRLLKLRSIEMSLRVGVPNVEMSLQARVPNDRPIIVDGLLPVAPALFKYFLGRALA